jgi:hypothetical protein
VFRFGFFTHGGVCNYLVDTLVPTLLVLLSHLPHFSQLLNFSKVTQV